MSKREIEQLLNILLCIGKQAEWKGFLEWEGTTPGVTNQQNSIAVKKREKGF